MHIEEKLTTAAHADKAGLCVEPAARLVDKGHKTSLVFAPPDWAMTKMTEHLGPSLGRKELAGLCIIWAGLFIQKGKLLFYFYTFWYIFHFIH